MFHPIMVHGSNGGGLFLLILAIIVIVAIGRKGSQS